MNVTSCRDTVLSQLQTLADNINDHVDVDMHASSAPRHACRLKCWECGVKKKAPCGQTQRDDLPWCCHRRLGEWMALHSVTRADNSQKSITFSSEDLPVLVYHALSIAMVPACMLLLFQCQTRIAHHAVCSRSVVDPSTKPHTTWV